MLSFKVELEAKYLGFFRIPFSFGLVFSGVGVFVEESSLALGVSACDVGVSASSALGDISRRSLVATSARFCSALGVSWLPASLGEIAVDMECDMDDAGGGDSSSSFSDTAVSIDMSLRDANGSVSPADIVAVSTVAGPVASDVDVPIVVVFEEDMGSVDERTESDVGVGNSIFPIIIVINLLFPRKFLFYCLEKSVSCR